MPIAYLGATTADGGGAWTLPLTLNAGDVLSALQTRADGTSSLLAANVIASNAQTPPTASFSWTQSTQSMAVTFTDTSTGQPTTWSWDFGDSSQSNAQSPLHAYAAAGDYTVVLTAANNQGSTQQTQTVHVNAVATVYAADSFGRQVSNSWSSADIGGAYTLFADSTSYNVGGGTGQMILTKAGNTRSAILGSVSAGDVDIKVRFAIDKVPVGGSQYVYLIARSIGNSSYRPKVIIATNGSVAVHAGVVNNGSESSLGNSVTVPGLTATAGGYMWLHAQVTGTNPSTIKVRAWRDGDAEPSTWQFSATNSLAALQAAGGVGLAAVAGSGTSNVPVTFAFDDLTAIDPNGGGPVAPTASYTYAQEQNSLVVDFADHSTGSPTSWSWDFGDGTTSTARNPAKTYATAGAYIVTLTAANSAGQSSAAQTVSVAAPVAIIYVQDAFTRTVVGGWGSADIGGAYNAAGGAAAVNVANGAGTIAPPRAGATRGVTVDSVAARDVDIVVRVAVDKLPVGGNVWAYEVARHNGNNEYRPKILITPAGAVLVHAGTVVSDAEAPIGQPVTVPGLTVTPGSFVWVHAQVTGTSPTTVRVRAWADGQSEPTAWQYVGTDSTAVLQQAGSVGLRVYTDTKATNAPVAVAFDDYRVADPNAGAGGSGPTVTLVGAGDIAGCDWTDDSDTGAVINGVPGIVFTAGDNAYPEGSATTYTGCYDPAWGAFKARTRPTPGNHDVQADASATAYYDYFGTNAGYGRRGYYAYEAGTWRVYALNSECAGTSSCAAQYAWLAADLAAAPHQCSLAIWHRPRFSEGPHGSANDLDSLFKLLYTNGVELLVSGHDHMYERLAPVDGSGQVDTSRGVRQIVVGTGGAALYTPATTLAIVEAEDHVTHGALRLDLAPGSYSWQFLPAGSGTYSDSGTTACH